jgi:hypothetical protein
MIFELFEDMVKMVFIVFCLHVVFRTYVRLRQPAWSMALERRRLATLLVLVLAVLAIKVTEDVLGGESGPIDKAILFFIHDHVSPAWTATFRAITLSGSASVLTPGIAAVTAILLLRRHRHEAFLRTPSALAIGVVLRLELPERSHAGRRCDSRGPRAGRDSAAAGVRPLGHRRRLGLDGARGALAPRPRGPLADGRAGCGLHWCRDTAGPQPGTGVQARRVESIDALRPDGVVGVGVALMSTSLRSTCRPIRSARGHVTWTWSA